MYGHPALRCMGAGCVFRLELRHLVALLYLRRRPAYRRPFAFFSMGGGFLSAGD